jgi:DNA repair and recombination RAD54-like protein
MFECVTGLKEFDGNGCILADDMGLGKTLQGITLLWTLLKQGAEELGGKPVVKRAVIVCPTSLVGNWDDELDKWLDGRVKSLALAESSRDDAIMGIDQFLSPRKPYDVLIVSYETFRIHTKKFKREGSLDLLICDEAHRLKNAETQTNQALNDLPCKRRVLLSGTPMQNHLDEFYAMVNFTNPGVLGTPAHFRRHFEGPVLAGREPDATEKQIEKSNERSLELSTIVNEFILRRTNSLLSKHLPPKTIEIVCCKMTKLQEDLYKHFLHSKVAKQLLNAGKSSTRVLSAITALKKLCNHPKLIYDVVNSMQKDTVPDGFEDCGKFFPPGVFDNGRVGRGGMALGWENFSGKMAVLSRLLSNLRPTGDRIVLVSNYTQTLDLFVQLCREKRFPYVRLDGSISIKKRMKLVKEFNDPAQDQFVFLLSSKAGGCGLNLIGANRLILFDPDWNPATDKQAAARVWRDGQKKYVFTYRFFATGTIEEKVFQRQLSKEGLQGLVSKDGKAKSNSTSSEVLRDLFRYRGEDTFSDTYDNCDAGNRESLEEKDKEVWNQVGEPAEEDLKHWAHHFNLENLPDPIMQKSAGNDISFVFSCDVKGQDLSKMNGNKENEKEEEEEEEEKPQLNTLQQRRGVLNILNTNAGGVARQPGLLRSRLPANNLKRKILQSRAAAALSTKKRQIEDSGDEESVTEESMEESDLDLESDEDDGGGESSEDFSE